MVRSSTTSAEAGSSRTKSLREQQEVLELEIVLGSDRIVRVNLDGKHVFRFKASIDFNLAITDHGRRLVISETDKLQ
jgi:hypothetical protein